MTYNQNTLPTETSHHILLENRSRLAVSGVEEVESFDENQIVMSTCQGVRARFNPLGMACPKSQA